MKHLLALLVLTIFYLPISPAYAACNKQDGYLFVYGWCHQTQTSHPVNVCEVGNGGSPEYVYFVSNVIQDSAKNRQDPEKVFLTAIKDKFGVTPNVHASTCRTDKKQAGIDHQYALNRAERSGWEIEQLSIKNS